MGIDALTVVIAMLFKIAAVTFTVAVPLMDPKVAVTVELPTAAPVTKPGLPFPTVTIVPDVAVHDASFVRSFVVLSV